MKPENREEFEKDPLYPFYDFINYLVSKLADSKTDSTDKVVETKYLPYDIQKAKNYTKSNWKIIFSYHYLKNAKDSDHCKKKHPLLSELLHSHHKKSFMDNVLVLLNKIISYADLDKPSEIIEFNDFKLEEIHEAFHMNTLKETS